MNVAFLRFKTSGTDNAAGSSAFVLALNLLQLLGHFVAGFLRLRIHDKSVAGWWS